MKIRLVISTILLLAWYNSKAQESLTLNEAIQLGLSNNYQIQLTKIDKDIAMTNNNWGEAGRYPTITISGGNNNGITERNNPTSFINGLIRQNSFNGTINAGWTIFGGFAVNITKERLSLLQNQSENQEALIIENTVQAIILAYRQIILESQKLEVFASMLKLSKDKLDYTMLKKQSGLSSSFDVRQFENAYLEDSINLTVQKLNLRNAKRNLNLLLARDINDSIQCTDSISVTLNEYRSDSLLKLLTKNNKQLQLEFLNLDLLRNSNQLAKSSLFPNLSLNLGASTSQATIRIDGLPNNRGSNREYYANFTLSYTLFDGGKIKRSINTTAMQIDQGVIQTKELELSLKNEIITQVDLYNTRSAILGIRKQQEEQTSLNLELANERIKSGLISSFDYREIQMSHLQNTISTLEAIYNLSESEVELQRLTGQIFSFNN